MGARVTKGLQDVTPDNLRIDELHETGRELGNGSYGTVTEVRYKGTLCACKRVHNILVGEGGDGRVVAKFQAECNRMGKLRHPNIVQFLGIYFERPSSLPALVMELLPLSLDALLKNYKDVPYYIKISILLDVSLALLFLHKQSPPIMHRDLSVYNVLLTHSLRAKLSDLGVSRDLLSLTQAEDAPPLSIAPGNRIYMPPEALEENPSYGLSLDVYSFGQLIVHVVKGRCPDEKREGDEGREGQKEVEEIAEGPMKMLARTCLKEDPVRRPATEEVVVAMEKERERNPAPFRHLMDLLHHRKEEEKDDEKEEKREENGVEAVRRPPAEPALGAAGERRLWIPPSLEREGMKEGHNSPVVMVTAAEAQINGGRRPSGTRTYLPSTGTAAPPHQATFNGGPTTLPVPKPRSRLPTGVKVLPPRTTNPAPVFPYTLPPTFTTPTAPQAMPTVPEALPTAPQAPPAVLLQAMPTVREAPPIVPQVPPAAPQAPPTVPQTTPTVYPNSPTGPGHATLEVLSHGAVIFPSPTALSLLPLASEPTISEPTALEPDPSPPSPVPEPAPPPSSPVPEPPPSSPVPKPAPPTSSPVPKPAQPLSSPVPEPTPPPSSPVPKPTPPPSSPVPEPAPPTSSPVPEPAPPPSSPVPEPALPTSSPAPTGFNKSNTPSLYPSPSLCHHGYPSVAGWSQGAGGNERETEHPASTQEEASGTPEWVSVTSRKPRTSHRCQSRASCAAGKTQGLGKD